MSIPSKDVQVGRFFARESDVREVITDLGPDIRYRRYMLETGELYIGLPSECSRQELAQWAERECTTEEGKRMQRDLAEHLEEDFMLEYLRSVLHGVPNKMLLDEMRRRGLSFNS